MPDKAVLGMIHLPPLPGTPFHRDGSLGEIRATALRSARALREGGADGCLVQTADRVYSPADDADPARVAALALIVAAIADETGFEVGVQVMRNAVRASLAVAKVAGGTFVRVGALVGATLTPQGIVQADPLGVAEYRRRIGADGVRVIADVASMHFRWLGGGRAVGQVARDARAAGADAVAVSDPDEAAALALIAEVREAAPGLPVYLAGHTNHENAARLLAEADGAFVGTCLERGGWGGEIDRERVEAYVAAVR